MCVSSRMQSCDVLGCSLAALGHRKTWREMVDQNLLKSIQAIVGAEANRHVQEFCGKIKKEVQHATANDECTDMMNALWGDGAYGNRLTCSSSWLKLLEMVQSVKGLGVPKGRLFSASGNKTDDHFAALNAAKGPAVQRLRQEDGRPLRGPRRAQLQSPEAVDGGHPAHVLQQDQRGVVQLVHRQQGPDELSTQVSPCFSPPSCSFSSSLFLFLFLSSLPFLLLWQRCVVFCMRRVPGDGTGHWRRALGDGMAVVGLGRATSNDNTWCSV